VKFIRFVLVSAPLALWYKIYSAHWPKARKTVSDFPTKPVCNVEPPCDLGVQSVSKLCEKLLLPDHVQSDFGRINNFATRWPDGKDVLEAPRTSDLAIRSRAANSNTYPNKIYYIRD
jgi:hypothetical protein